MDSKNLITALGVPAGGAVLAWLRPGRGRPAKTPRGRLCEVSWCVAFLVLALTITDTFLSNASMYFSSSHSPTLLAVLVGAGIPLIFRPRLAFGLVPAAAIFLGLYGFVVARDYGFWTHYVGNYAFLPVGDYNMRYYLVLPLAYSLLLLGGWLAWRVIDHESMLARIVLGRLANPASPSRLWAFLLLPVVFMAAMIFCPNIFFGSGLAGAVWTTVILLGTFAIIRRSPASSAGLATAGLIILGAISLRIAGTYRNFGLPKPVNRYVLDGLVAVSNQSMAHLAIAQAIALISFGLWLVPRTIPQARQLLGWASDADLIKRVQGLTESRAVAVDTAAADLRRLERDLHDGAQARLVALGMSLRAVERLIPVSPDAALALVVEARETSARALTELRELVRGVHPPVLADRGLGDAIRALALDTPLKIETDIDLPGRLAAPVETACYFAVAEVLTNAAKHSGAREGRISVAHADGMLRIAVTDFGVGGADPARGSGLTGVEKRLATFDGIVAVSSPVGGPTMVVLEVPCASSSQRISASSGA
jgi:signal transduction histidine kinase